MPQQQGVTLGACPWGRKFIDLSKEELQPEEKYWLVGAYNLGILSAQELKKRFNLSSKLVSAWARGVANGVNLYSKGGRPSFLEEEDLETLRREMTNQVVQVTPRQFQDRVKELYEARQISKGVARRDIVKLSKRYFTRLQEKLGVSISKSHVTTDARVLAVHDLRNAVTMAAMNQVVVPLSHPALITNVDSSVMITGRNYESEGEALFIVGPKALLRYLDEEEVEYDPVLVNTLKGIVEEQRQKYSGISAAYEKSIVRGLIKVHHCLVKGIKRVTIKQSFRNCGIYPLSIEEILACSTSWSTITEDERQLCLRSMPELTHKMAKHGTLTERDLDRALIPKTITERTKIPKNLRTLCRRRACILTHKLFIAKETAKRDLAARQAAAKEAQREAKRQKRMAAENSEQPKKKRKKNPQPVAPINPTTNSANVNSLPAEPAPVN